MSKVKPITELTPAACEQVLDLMLAACKRIAADHGLVIEGSQWRPELSGKLFETRFRVSLPGVAEEERKLQKQLFAVAAEHLGLKASDFEREFRVEGDLYKITGIDPRRPKYPISAQRVSDGRACKLPIEDVVKLLKGEVRSTHA
jgi:hypothetical protein